jgi:hypothetical protein
MDMPSNEYASLTSFPSFSNPEEFGECFSGMNETDGNENLGAATAISVRVIGY